MAIQAKCEKCGKDFLIINKEVEFYKEKDFPLPKLCPEHRLERRIALRNKKELLGYNCDSCGKDIIIAFDPVEGQEVYCKECFQKYMQEHDCILGYSEGAKAAGMESTAPAPAEAPQNTQNDQNPPAGEVKDPVSW